MNKKDRTVHTPHCMQNPSRDSTPPKLMTEKIVLCRLLLFVSTLAKCLAGKTYSSDIFRVEGFPQQRPDWRVINCIGLLYVRVNIIRTVLYWQRATSLMDTVNKNSSDSPVGPW